MADRILVVEVIQEKAAKSETIVNVLIDLPGTHEIKVQPSGNKPEQRSEKPVRDL